MSARSPIKALAIAGEDEPQGKLRNALSISAARKRRQREKARDRHMPAFFAHQITGCKGVMRNVGGIGKRARFSGSKCFRRPPARWRTESAYFRAQKGHERLLEIMERRLRLLEEPASGSRKSRLGTDQYRVLAVSAKL